MKLICDGLDLCEAVNKVIKAVSARTTQPILEGIKLKAEESTLTLTATDLELCIEKKIKAEIITTGETVVTGKVFSDFIKKLSNERVELELTENNRLKIKYGESSGQLSCFNVDEFPRIAELESPESFSIVKKEFKDMINKVAFCVGNDESRPVFSGIFIEVEEVNINAVAIDGTRMAYITKPLEKKSALMSMIVPAKSILEISKILEDSEEIVTIYRQKNILMADLGHTKVITRLIEGDFINYRAIYPAKFNTAIKVNRAQLEDGLERATVIARYDENKEVKFDIKEGTLTMTCQSQHGSIRESVIIALEGKDIEISFNSGYIADALNAIKDEYIKICFIEEISPCVISPVKTEEFKYLILPIRPKQ